MASLEKRRLGLLRAFEATEEKLFERGYKYHHAAWARGYISRKIEGPVVRPYKGRFGTGYTVEVPSWGSSNYHRVHYYIREEERPLPSEEAFEKARAFMERWNSSEFADRDSAKEEFNALPDGVLRAMNHIAGF